MLTISWGSGVGFVPLVQLCVHKEHEVLGEGQVEQRPEIMQFISPGLLFADQCFYQLIEKAVLLSYLLVQRVINCYLLKVIQPAFRRALLHLDRWDYIHLPSPLATGKINETLISLTLTFSWGKCWQSRINVSIDLLLVSKGVDKTSPPTAGRGDGERAASGHFLGPAHRPVLSGQVEETVAERLIHLGSTSWRLAGPSSGVPKPWTLSSSTASTSYRPLQTSVTSSTKWGWRSLMGWLWN